MSNGNGGPVSALGVVGAAAELRAMSPEAGGGHVFMRGSCGRFGAFLVETTQSFVGLGLILLGAPAHLLPRCRTH